MTRMDTNQNNPSSSHSCSFVPFVAACLLAGCNGPTSKGPPPSAGPVDAGQAALRAGQFDAAIADADDYLRGQPAGPRAAEADYVKGSAYQQTVAVGPAEQRRNLFEARTAYLAALNAHPPAELEGYVRAGLSTVALFQDDFSTAIEQAEAAAPLVTRPATKAGLLYNTGLAQQRLGRFTDADQTFRQVVQQYPGTPPAAAAQQHVGQRLVVRPAGHLRLAGRRRPGHPFAAGQRVGRQPPVGRDRPHRAGPRPLQHLRRRPTTAGRRVGRLPRRRHPALTERHAGH